MKPVHDLIRYTDASGHEHAPAGRPDGGQFTKSAGELASSLSAGQQGHAQENTLDEAIGELLDKERISRLDADGLDMNWLAEEMKVAGIPASAKDIQKAGARIAAAYKASRPTKPISATKKTPKGESTESSQPKRNKSLGVMGKPAVPGSVPGQFDANNQPSVGDTISYFDGEGGFSGTKATEQVGRVLAVSPGDGRGIQVMARSGHKVWIDNEAARPYTAKQ